MKFSVSGWLEYFGDILYFTKTRLQLDEIASRVDEIASRQADVDSRTATMNADADDREARLTAAIALVINQQYSLLEQIGALSERGGRGSEATISSAGPIPVADKTKNGV